METKKTRRVKLYEDWSDDDLKDLVGDLDSVGAVRRMSFCLTLTIPGFVTQSSRNVLHLPILEGSIIDTDTASGNQRAILGAIQAGECVKPEVPGLDWRTLSVRMSRTMESLKKESVLRLAREWKGDLHGFLIALQGKTDDEVAEDRRQMYLVSRLPYSKPTATIALSEGENATEMAIVLHQSHGTLGSSWRYVGNPVFVQFDSEGNSFDFSGKPLL
jgi:hypothetical protein